MISRRGSSGMASRDDARGLLGGRSAGLPVHPVAGTLTRMHERQYVDGRADRVTNENEHHQVRKATDGVSAPHVSGLAEGREAHGGLEDVANTPSHLREELLPEPRDGVFIAGGCLVEL